MCLSSGKSTRAVQKALKPNVFILIYFKGAWTVRCTGKKYYINRVRVFVNSTRLRLGPVNMQKQNSANIQLACKQALLFGSGAIGGAAIYESLSEGSRALTT